MPYSVTFQLDAFNGTRDIEESLADLSAMLDCLISIDMTYLQRHPNTPLLYKSGVRYQDEPIGAEFWRDIPTVLRYLDADCEDLACWLVAEKRVRFGIPARPIIIPQLKPNGRFLYHINVGTPNPRAPGGVEVDDPSRRLGMK